MAKIRIKEIQGKPVCGPISLGNGKWLSPGETADVDDAIAAVCVDKGLVDRVPGRPRKVETDGPSA